MWAIRVSAGYVRTLAAGGWTTVRSIFDADHYGSQLDAERAATYLGLPRAEVTRVR